MSPQRRPLRKRLVAPTRTSAAWIAARARNALRRPVFIGTVSVITFVTALLALVVVPQQARRAAAALRPAVAARPDTEPTVAALVEAERQVARADSALAAARTEIAQLVAATAATLVDSTTAAAPPDSASAGATTPGSAGRRDSLRAQVAVLTRLLARAENAPLLPSYRALAQAAPLQGEVRVKQLLDSLVDIEREREGYSAVGGVDPVFVALTARANELGRSIETLAQTRRAALEREIQALSPAPALAASATAARPLPDTVALARQREEGRAAAAEVGNRLARERAELARLDALEERARELDNVGASPSAILAAALVFAVILGFGTVLLDEVRHPRVADAYEVERATGVRVLGTIAPVARVPERTRRIEDRAVSPYLDPGADGHQLVYLTTATAGSNVVMLTVTGDHPGVAAVVAMNFAAIAADEARETLLIDTGGTTASVTAALHVRSGAGFRAVAAGEREWNEVTSTVRLGRERTIDIVPSGAGEVPVAEAVEVIRRDAPRLTQRYDALVLVCTPAQVTGGLAAALPVPDVLYCARVGMTPVEELRRTLAQVEERGGHVRGVVLWGSPDPRFDGARPEVEVEREPAIAT